MNRLLSINKHYNEICTFIIIISVCLAQLGVICVAISAKKGKIPRDKKIKLYVKKKKYPKNWY